MYEPKCPGFNKNFIYLYLCIFVFLKQGLTLPLTGLELAA